MADGISYPSSGQHVPTDQPYFPNNFIIPPLRSEGAGRKRPKYTRSMTGCLTCRAKKIKCDETKPNCMRCTHGSRECSWPETQRNRQQKAKHRQSPSLSSFSSLVSLSSLDARHAIANATRASPSASFSARSSPISTTNTSLDPISAPFLPRVRRGYWNRRGDHLMPDGHIVYSPLALAYPVELSEYPSEEDGYQNEEGAFIQYAERPELSASLSLRGRAPERPYHTFVVYVDDDSKRSLSPLLFPIDSFSSLPPGNKQVDEAGSPSMDPHPVSVSDPWDLDTRLAAFNSRRPKSPTSSSSSYGSAHSVHSRASSFSGTAGGHIPGTNRDVLEFPFGYPNPIP